MLSHNCRWRVPSCTVSGELSENQRWWSVARAHSVSCSCATQDGHIVVRHDVLLDGDSDVDIVGMGCGLITSVCSGNFPLAPRWAMILISAAEAAMPLLRGDGSEAWRYNTGDLLNARRR